jgi:hypothetical protein
MPEELKSEEGFQKAVAAYKTEIVKERYQPLSSLLNTLKTLCLSNSTQCQELV